MAVDSATRAAGRHWKVLGAVIAGAFAAVVVVLVLVISSGTSRRGRATGSSGTAAVISAPDAEALSQTLGTGSGPGASEELRALAHKALRPGTRGGVTIDPESLRVASVGDVGIASGALAGGKKLTLVLALERGHWRLVSAAVHQ